MNRIDHKRVRVFRRADKCRFLWFNGVFILYLTPIRAEKSISRKGKLPKNDEK